MHTTRGSGWFWAGVINLEKDGCVSGLGAALRAGAYGFARAVLVTHLHPFLLFTVLTNVGILCKIILRLFRSLQADTGMEARNRPRSLLPPLHTLPINFSSVARRSAVRALAAVLTKLLI